MKLNRASTWTLHAVLVLTAAHIANPAFGQALVSSAITYQGRLDDNGQPANGAYDFEYRLFDDDDAGVQVGTTKTSADLGVVDGLFTVKLDFGNVYNSDARWLEVSVRLGSSSGSYTKLLPRQELTAAPYAMGLRLPLTFAVNSSLASPFSITNTGLSTTAYFENDAFLGDALAVVANGASGSNAIKATANGFGDCGLFEVTDESSPGAAILATSVGNGSTIESINEGDSGGAGFFEITDESNVAAALEAVHAGFGDAIYATSVSGDAGAFEITEGSVAQGEALQATSNGGSDSQVLNATHTGTGDCGYFEISNSASVGEAVEARTNGGGDAVQAINSTTTGSGRAGYFEITGSLNNSPALQVQTTGPGMAILANDPIQIFGDDAEPGSGGYLILGDPASTSIAIDNNEIMARNAGVVATLFLNNDGGDVNVGGPLLVRNKVLCEELEVQLEEDWPDYVFDDGYALMPLNEVEAAIKEKGHLPGIPSAQTIREEGISVGSMQAQLLHKIEELTLHMIELDKQVSTMRDENARLKGQLAEITGSNTECEVTP